MMKNYDLLNCRLSTHFKTMTSGVVRKEPLQAFSAAKSSLLLGFAFFFLLSLGNMTFAQTIIINPATDGSFEGADFAAGGWTALNNANGGGSWVQSTGAIAGFTGTKSAYISNDETASPPPHAYNLSGVRTSALYKDVTIPAGEPTITLSFKWVGVGESGYDRLQVWAVPTDYTPLNANASMTTTGVAPTGRIQLGAGAAGYHSSANWTTANITVPPAYAGTSFRLVFQWRNDASGGSNPPIAIDDVSLISVCTGVIATSATAITTTSATANWTAFAGATTYDLRYRVAGAASWTLISGIAGTSAPLTSLVPYTSYEYQVMANGPVCNTFSPSMMFFSGYCSPTGGTSYYLTNVTTTGGLTNISNATGSNGGYADFSATNSVSAISGQTVTLNLSTNTSTHYFYGWIDWNNDLNFNGPNESIFATTTYTAGYSGPITIPAGTPAGSYRMRVANSYSGAITACGQGINGEYEDYTFIVIDQTPCSGTPAAATVTSSTPSVCISGSVTLTATIPASADSGFTYQWYNTAGAIAGATANTYTTPTLSAPESYFFKTTCINSGLSADSNTVVIGVNNPAVVSTTPNARCGVGTVNLSATASAGATLNWYAAATGGNPIGSGSTFTTPSIAATTDFYVSANAGGSTANGGVLSPIGTSSYADGTTGLVFSATTAFTLNSVVVYNNGAAGTLVINLTNSSGTVLQTSATFSVPAGSTSNLAAYTANLNWNIPVGSGYRLLAASGTTVSNSSLVRDSSGFGSYPFALGTVGSITGGYFGSASNSYYNFYNWSVSTGCSSARTAVTASVNSSPTLTLSSTSSAICAGNSTNTVTVTSGASDYDTFVWSPTTGVSGNVVDGFVFNPATTTTYTLTATNTGDCVNTTVHTVTVNPLPSAITITADSTICSTEATMLSVLSGGSINITPINESFATTTLPANWVKQVGTGDTVAIVAGTSSGGSGNQLVITGNSQTAIVTDRVSFGPINSVGLTTMTLQWNNFLNHYSSTPYTYSAKIQTSTDGVNWHDTSWSYSPVTASIAVGLQTTTIATTDVGSSTLYVAFTVEGRTFGMYNWNIDNVVLSGSVSNNITWSPTTNLYTDAAATIPYTGASAGTVYVKSPTAGSQMYTATSAILETGCSTTATTTLTTTVTAQPTADAQTFCNGSTVADLVATGTAVKWYSVATGGTALANTASLATGTYYASQTLNACESARTSVAVTVVTTAAPTASAQIFCNSATVADLVATGTSIQWYSVAAGGTALANTAALATGTYYVSQTENACESVRTSVAVTVNTPAAPTASAQTFCNEASVADLVATGTAIQWYSTLTGGTALAATAPLATGTYYASQTENACESARTSVDVTVNTTVAPTASQQAVCSGATVADLVATGTDIQWYSVSTGGTALANTAVVVAGTYYASQTLNACESTRTTVDVTVNALPTTIITRMDDTLTVSEENATYQWVLCDESFTPIAGATSQSYTATATGSYAVIITANNCNAISECFDLTTLSNKTFDVANLGYYPNPVTDVLTVSHSNTISSIQVFDITGRLVRKMNANSNEVKVDMANMPAAVYIVKVFTENTSGEFKVIKK